MEKSSEKIRHSTVPPSCTPALVPHLSPASLSSRAWKRWKSCLELGLPKEVGGCRIWEHWENGGNPVTKTEVLLGKLYRNLRELWFFWGFDSAFFSSNFGCLIFFDNMFILTSGNTPHPDINGYYISASIQEFLVTLMPFLSRTNKAPSSPKVYIII